MNYNLHITLEEAAFGCKKEIPVQSEIICPECNGGGVKVGSTICPKCFGTRNQDISKMLFPKQRDFQKIRKTGNIEIEEIDFPVCIVKCMSCSGTGIIETTTSCPVCNGSGELTKRIPVELPAGINTGYELKIAGKEEANTEDLIVTVHVKDHKIFKRSGKDLFCEVSITPVQAKFGREIDVPTLEGNIKMKIPSDTSSGAVFPLKGIGIPDLNSHVRGDQHVKVIVLNGEIPKTATSFGIKIGNRYQELIGKGTPYPTGSSVKIPTAFNNQTYFEFSILQEHMAILWFILSGIPSRVGEKTEVRIEIDEDGILNVSANDSRIKVERVKILDYYKALHSKEELYKILSIKEDASQDNIEEASKYKKRIYPKDSGERAIEEIRGIVNSASTTLSTLENRAKYHVQRVFKKLKVKGRDYWRIEDILKDFKDKEQDLEAVIKKGDTYIEKRVKEILKPDDEYVPEDLKIPERAARDGDYHIALTRIKYDVSSGKKVTEEIPVPKRGRLRDGEEIRIPGKGRETIIPGLCGDAVVRVRVIPEPPMGITGAPRREERYRERETPITPTRKIKDVSIFDTRGKKIGEYFLAFFKVLPYAFFKALLYETLWTLIIGFLVFGSIFYYLSGSDGIAIACAIISLIVLSTSGYYIWKEQMY